MKYIKGFRMLTLGWSDGNSYVPIAHRLLSSSKDENMIGVDKIFDKRSIAYKRRKQARTKATDVMVDMLKTAIKCGHRAKYVLFDICSCKNRVCQKPFQQKGMACSDMHGHKTRGGGNYTYLRQKMGY